MIVLDEIKVAEKRQIGIRKRGGGEKEVCGAVIYIETGKILPNRLQPRVHFESNSTIRLADSIRRYGILQPLTVREKAGNGEEQLYEIIAGERRFRAAKMIGMEAVPCIILAADDRKSAELALIENLLREDLNIFETARAIKKLIDCFFLTQEEVAKRLSLSQSSVANKLRLLKYSPEEEKLILENNLTERHARALLKISESSERIAAIGTVIRLKMNVSSTEAYVERLLSAEEKGSDPKARKKPIIKDIRVFYNSLDHALDIVRSAGVEISSKKTESEEGIRIEILIPNPR